MKTILGMLSLVSVFIGWTSFSMATTLSVVGGSGFLTATATSGGVYTIKATKMGWSYEGNLGVEVSLEKRTDEDGVGHFSEIIAKKDGGPSYSIRVYQDRPVVLFGEKAENIPANQIRFPRFSKYPLGLKKLSYRRENFSPTTFDLSGDAPWVFFDSQANCAILSPANHFMISNNFKEQDQSISVGVENQVTENGSLDFGAILVMAPGINNAYQVWGNALTDLSGKNRPTNESDPVLRTLGYWTDNRSSYYYNYVRELGYRGTLQNVLKEFNSQGIKLGHLQLDSWWYVKGGDIATTPVLQPSWKNTNYKHGIYLYEAASELFPSGLAAFQISIGIPLVTHSRWIDSSSPYVGKYQFSKQVSTDPLFWDNTMRYLQDNGVATYEQDWLDEKALPRLDRIGDADEFLDQMSLSAERYGISLQYCMPLPRHFLQGSRYSNLHSIRPSGDGFERGKWTQFIFGSRLASAVGIWPWADVFFSQDVKNLLIANLSAGIVGVGDRLGGTSGDYNPGWCKNDVRCLEMNADNLHHVVRADGIVVKPDTSLVPLDKSFVTLADASKPKTVVAMASTLSSSGIAAAYLFAYAPEKSHDAVFTLDPQEFGISGPAYLYRYFEGTGEPIPAGSTKQLVASEAGSYFILVPLDGNGLAVIGDPNLFVTLGRRRVETIEKGSRSTTLEIHFAPGESQLLIRGFSSTVEPHFTAEGCTFSSESNPETKRFDVRLSRQTHSIDLLEKCNLTLSGGQRESSP